MLAVEIQKFDVQPETILNDPLNLKLLETLTRFSNLLKTYNFDVKVYSEKSLKKLNEMPEKRKAEICEYYQNWINWIESEDSQEIEEIEKVCLKKALDLFELEVSDDFLKTLQKGQIVEVYGEDMIQLYRSLNFFKITSYSLLDITVFEWYLLWNRPSKAIQETLNDLNEVITSYVPVKKFQIPKQLIEENYNTGLATEPFTKRAIMAQFLNAGSLSAKGNKMGHLLPPKGFICSSFADVIAMGDEASNIQFI